jgi:hypothetical protein
VAGPETWAMQEAAKTEKAISAFAALAERLDAPWRPSGRGHGGDGLAG